MATGTAAAQLRAVLADTPHAQARYVTQRLPAVLATPWMRAIQQEYDDNRSWGADMLSSGALHAPLASAYMRSVVDGLARGAGAFTPRPGPLRIAHPLFDDAVFADAIDTWQLHSVEEVMAALGVVVRRVRVCTPSGKRGQIPVLLGETPSCFVLHCYCASTQTECAVRVQRPYGAPAGGHVHAHEFVRLLTEAALSYYAPAVMLRADPRYPTIAPLAVALARDATGLPCVVSVMPLLGPTAQQLACTDARRAITLLAQFIAHASKSRAHAPDAAVTVDHGDLHLQNLAMHNGRLVAFDWGLHVHTSTGLGGVGHHITREWAAALAAEYMRVTGAALPLDRAEVNVTSMLSRMPVVLLHLFVQMLPIVWTARGAGSVELSNTMQECFAQWALPLLLGLWDERPGVPVPRCRWATAIEAHVLRELRGCLQKAGLDRRQMAPDVLCTKLTPGDYCIVTRSYRYLIGATANRLAVPGGLPSWADMQAFARRVLLFMGRPELAGDS